MRFVSTRGTAEAAGFAEAVSRGLAPDGGLYVPEALPPEPDLDALLERPWPDRSALLVQRWLGDELGAADAAGLARRAFDFPVPLVPAGDVWALELFHGPSLAFKDFGARFLAEALGLLRARRAAPDPATVLVATSGDTGGAVARAFWRREGVRVVVLYPAGRVSSLQERQLASLGDNVLALRVRGSFDDCQALAKACFADRALAAELGLTSANSINVARLLAQGLYYFEAVAALRRAGRAPAPAVAVPSGNLGNLCAGLMARRLGLPLAALVAASNANRTFPDYLDSGRYQPRPSVPTLSNAMDVGDPSNWERIRHLFGGDLAALRSALRWGCADDDATRATLRELQAAGYLADPHSAVACRVLGEQAPAGVPGVFLATAHPAKFAEVLEPVLGVRVPLPPALAELLARPPRSEAFEGDATALKARLRSH
jgi:threonine synthase